MTSSLLRRVSGATLAVAAALCVVGGVLHPVVHGEAHSAEALTSPHEAVGSLLLLAGTALLLLALPGVYGALAPRLGWLGLVGFVVYFLGNLLSAVPHLVVMTFIGPSLARQAPELVSDHDLIVGTSGFETEQVAAGIALILGLLLLAVAVARGGSGLRWVGLVGVAAAVLLVVPLPAAEVVSGIQVELLRGVFVAALGIVVARGTTVLPSSSVAARDVTHPASVG